VTEALARRTSLVAMLTFLEINGHRVNATDRELADWIISFSVGATPQVVADVVRSRLARV
jgi:prophage maintenance system killer protein